MIAKRLTMLFVLLVGLDLSCPMVPGALMFAVEDSVEARLSLSPHVAYTPRALMPTTGPDEVTVIEPRVVVLKPPANTRPAGIARRGRSSTFLTPEPSASLVDDH